jgi:hypothetical protein
MSNPEHKMMWKVSDTDNYKKAQKHAMANMVRACEEMTTYFNKTDCLTFAINCIDELTSENPIPKTDLFQSVNEDVLFDIPYKRS